MTSLGVQGRKTQRNASAKQIDFLKDDKSRTSILTP